MTVQRGLRGLGQEKLHLAVACPYCSTTVCGVVVWRTLRCACWHLREAECKEVYALLQSWKIQSLTYTNMFPLQQPSDVGQVCCLETKRSPPMTEITQTRCDICSGAAATSRNGACRPMLLSGSWEKEPWSKYAQFQEHIAFCHALLTQPWHHKSWNKMHPIALNHVYLKCDFLLQRLN